MTDSVHNSVSGNVTGDLTQAHTVNNYPPLAPPPPPEDELADQVLDHWTDEANARDLTGSVQMPVRWDARQLGAPDDSTSTVDVLALVRSLDPVRLIVTGPAGAGKSSLAVLLVLDLLAHRKSTDPVPVLLSLSGWTPKKNLRDWVVERIQQDYRGFTGPAGKRALESLFARKKVIPVLDGLDEVLDLPDDEVTKGIDRWRRNTDAPLVLLSRPEAVDPLPADSELRNLPVLLARPVAADAGRRYLTGKCGVAQLSQWEQVFDVAVRSPDGPVATALSSPLMLWLATKVYASGARDPRELLDDPVRFREHTDIEGHLLDELLPALYTQGPAPESVPTPAHEWSVDQARRYHHFLARQLIRRRTQDIAWWHLRGALAGSAAWGGIALTVAALCGAVASYLTASLLIIAGHVWHQPSFASTFEALNLAAALATITTVLGRILVFHGLPGHDDGPRLPAGRRQQAHAALLAAAAAGTGVLVPGGFCSFALAMVLPALSRMLLTTRTESAAVTKPRPLLDGERRIVLGEAAVTALAVAIISAAFFPWTHTRPLLAAGSIVVAWSCSVVVLVALSRWGTWIGSRIEFSVRNLLPWDVMTFLEDAHHVTLLRQVGGVYQFRHAELRWRLAEVSPERPTADDHAPHAVVLRSSTHTIRALWRGGLALLMPVVAFFLVASPFSSTDGYRADWQQSWDLTVRWRFQLAALAAVFLVGTVLLRLVATKLRIDAEGIELARGRKLSLRWEDVAAVRIRAVENTLLPAQLHLELMPQPHVDIPKSRTKHDGWIRLWDLDVTRTLPLDLEAALTHFAGDRWKPKVPSAGAEGTRRRDR